MSSLPRTGAFPAAAGLVEVSVEPFAASVWNSAQALHIEVDQRARVVAFVADHRARRAVEPGEDGEASAAEDRVDGRGGKTELVADAVRASAKLTSQTADRFYHLFAECVG